MKHNYQKTYSLLSISITILLTTFPLYIRAADYYSPSLLNIAGMDTQLTNEDLDVFKENDLAPGDYYVKFYINNNHIFSKEVKFVLMPGDNDTKTLIPCFSLTEWESFGIDFHNPQSIEQECFNINRIEYMKSYLDLNTRVYSLSIPQAMINKKELTK
ncbi:FimD/PapC N-terminal domain-containing protein [Providencia manganoxydans]|uniref:FimD/PapC N-terminal domain-containing protein n=1 Tax=Providencia manganoxydans TaxID=2923283 RepID=UPI0034DD0974